jgi:hypothetical protein
MCEQAVDGELSKNVPLVIGLSLYIAQLSGDVLNTDDLKKLIVFAPSTVDRYILILESQGVVEKLTRDGLNGVELKLSANISEKFQSIFGEEIC